MKKLMIAGVITISVFLISCSGYNTPQKIFSALEENDFETASAEYYAIESEPSSLKRFEKSLENMSGYEKEDVSDFVKDLNNLKRGKAAMVQGRYIDGIDYLLEINVQCVKPESQDILDIYKEDIIQALYNKMNTDGGSSVKDRISRLSNYLTGDTSELKETLASIIDSEYNVRAEEKEKFEKTFAEYFITYKDSFTDKTEYYSKNGYILSDNKIYSADLNNKIFRACLSGNNIYLTIGIKNNDWIFFDKVDIKIDEEITSLDTGYFDVNRETLSDGNIIETVSIDLNSYPKLFNSIASASTVSIRLTGEKEFTFNLDSFEINMINVALVKISGKYDY